MTYVNQLAQDIILLLSNHRTSDNPQMPMTLTKGQLISLLRSNVSPNQNQDELISDINQNLSELQARGEISVGKGNRYCVAPPTLLVQDESNLTGLLFRGDRAYLALAHQVLGSSQRRECTHIRPQIRGFNRIKDRLAQAGIRLTTVSDSIQYLPIPQLPTESILRSPRSQNPFEHTDFPEAGIFCYIPRRNTLQKDRWTKVTRQSQLSNLSLIELHGEYIWFADLTFYELEPDIASLTMFALDGENNCPLRIVWDKAEGKIDLQDIHLPDSYAIWLWQLSEDGDRYQIRYVKPINQPLVESAFQRLGCSLV